ncbi:LuxR C-terminal-related transcriptional regulator [Kitasatospora sp. NPDC101183]|uniref:LuxR C-terminal-related transcriptional regulator n=1 Tax=Kitasatospora sp. NPDC101183 TaxID=3364100 RepID=UPI00382DBA0E
MSILLDQPLRHRTPAPPPVTTTAVRILLADGHHLFRSGLGALLDREEDLAVVAEAPTAEEAAEAAARTRPAVAVLDPDIPGATSDAVALIRDRSPSTALLLLTAQPRAAVLQRAVAEGVAGLLVKDVPPRALISAVRELARGGRVFDPRMVVDAVRAEEVALTPRELTVLTLVAEGASINEVARVLSLSPGTVRNYVSAAIAKTRARNRCDAIRIARERGWL